VRVVFGHDEKSRKGKRGKSRDHRPDWWVKASLSRQEERTVNILTISGEKGGEMVGSSTSRER